MLLCILMGYLGLAQKETPVNSALYLKGFAQGNKVQLRWAPGDKYLWKDGLSSGYKLIRKTLSRNGKSLPVAEVRVLKEQILPQPLAVWENRIKTHPMAGVVAQAIYGDGFQVTSSEGQMGVSEMILESDELTNRYAFSLYACDLNFVTATMAGLGYTDEDVEADASYVYEVRMNDHTYADPPAGVVFVSSNAASGVPLPPPVAAVAKDTSVVLSWNYREAGKFFPAYVIERSTDGEDYIQITDPPVTALSQDRDGNITFIDHPDSEGKYWYRIKGLDVFGNVSQASNPFIVETAPFILAVPEISGYDINEDGTIILKWQIGNKETSGIRKLALLRSPHPLGPFQVLKDTLTLENDQFMIKQNDPVSYYRLRAVDRYLRARESKVFQVQVADTIPPDVPDDLQARIVPDKGVKLSWNPGADADLKGYDLYFSPGENQSFLRLNKKPLTGHSFEFPLNKNNSLRNAHFYIRSVDQRYNVSTSSDTVSVKFHLPLQPPVIINYKYHSGRGLEIFWKSPGHQDISSYAVIRQEVNGDYSQKRELIRIVDKPEARSFTDAETKPGTTYIYTLVCITAEGRESAPSPPMTVSIPFKGPKYAEGKLQIRVNREERSVQLFWYLKGEEIGTIDLYRKTGSGPLSLYKTFEGEIKSFTDTRVSPNNTYGYLLTALTKNGEKLVLKEHTINF